MSKPFAFSASPAVFAADPTIVLRCAPRRIGDRAAAGKSRSLRAGCETEASVMEPPHRSKRRVFMSIAWQNDVDAALAKARTANRPILIDFNAAPL